MENNNKKKSIIGLIIISVFIILITVIAIFYSPYTYLKSSNTNNSSNNDDDLHTEYLSITNTSVSSNSSYTICSGTISVKSYSPYKYHYIKVKAAFKDRYGKTVDTDWTYAIGSEWLEPGESSKFRTSVSKDSSITSCTVTIME